MRLTLSQKLSFPFVNTSASFIGFEFTATLTGTDDGSGTFGVHTGMGKLERDNQTTRFVTTTPNNLITNISQAIDMSNLRQVSHVAV
jgi:hypothetical protein